MYARLLKAPNTSCFVLGPRGTGKSSWTRARFPKANVIDLLDAEVFTDLIAAPTRLSRYIIDHNAPVVIDEVQRAPALLDEVHRLIERDHRQFILTGSSARKLRAGGVNLLAGRARSLSMFPFTAHELGSDFNLTTALRSGLLPPAVAAADPRAFLKAYVQTYLREEVLQEGLTRSLPAFSRFLEAASFSQASVLNVTAVASDCAIPRKTAESYFQILDDLMIGLRVPSFTRRARRRVVTHAKFFYFDAGVFQAIRPRGPLDATSELTGLALETLVMQELRALIAYLDFDDTLHYWRTDSGLEVDFVLYGERGIRAFEVKSSDRLRSDDFKGLEAFLIEYPMARMHLIYGGSRRLKHGAIDVIPVKTFFKNAIDFL